MTLVQCILGDHGFGSGRFFHTHFPPGDVHSSFDNDVEVAQLVDEVEETSSDQIVQHLVDMMGDPVWVFKANILQFSNYLNP